VRYISSFHGIIETLKSGASLGRQNKAKLYVAKPVDMPHPGPRIRDIIELAGKLHVSTETVDAVYLDGLDPENKGVILALEESAAALPATLEEALATIPERAVALVLDHIEDPQNLGAIIRSADAFGVSFVVVPARRASPPTQAVVRASAGATAWVPVIVVQNLNDALKKLKSSGFWVYAADMEGIRLDSVELEPRTCFVLGNEGAGVSRLLMENADRKVAIPMVGHVESLNVSVSAALCMYEYRKKYPVEVFDGGGGEL
jgi:23S rRNA (guanosine2251-2'-O)-methyltransferase